MACEQTQMNEPTLLTFFFIVLMNSTYVVCILAIIIIILFFFCSTSNEILVFLLLLLSPVNLMALFFSLSLGGVCTDLSFGWFNSIKKQWWRLWNCEYHRRLTGCVCLIAARIVFFFGRCNGVLSTENFLCVCKQNGIRFFFISPLLERLCLYDFTSSNWCHLTF